MDVLRTATALRVLDRQDREAVLRLCARNAVVNVMVAERVELVGSEPYRLGGQLWGIFERGQLVSACWSGANLIPIEVHTETAIEMFADQARTGSYSSLFGEAAAVAGIWARLESMGWRARDVRERQPLYAIDTVPEIAADPDVHQASLDDLDRVLPASVAMFTEEVGYSPMGAEGGAYRRRVADLLRQGRTFVRFSANGEVIFKADLGSVNADVAQVHGVWVDPRWRGQGIAAPAMASVVRAGLRRSRTVSLYVNDFNVRAVAAYRRVGFRQVGTFATVLF